MAKIRSPNYPAVGLPDAIAYAKALWEKEKRTMVTAEVAAKALGYQSLSGPARSAIAALRKYGLIEGHQTGVQLSERAVRVIQYPPDSSEYRNAVREAALNPPLFRDLYETHADASDDALKAHLIHKQHFSEAGARQFIAAFRETLVLVKLSDPHYTPGTIGLPEYVDPETTETDASGRKSLLKVTRVYAWPLSKDVTAEVRLSGAGLRPAHLERLRQYLDLAKGALEEDDDAK